MSSHPDTCPACGSRKMILGAEFPDAVDFGIARKSTLRVPARPKAAIFKQQVDSTLEADVCGDCGFVQFYVSKPDRLWDAYQRGRSRGE